MLLVFLTFLKILDLILLGSLQSKTALTSFPILVSSRHRDYFSLLPYISIYYRRLSAEFYRDHLAYSHPSMLPFKQVSKWLASPMRTTVCNQGTSSSCLNETCLLPLCDLSLCAVLFPLTTERKSTHGKQIEYTRFPRDFCLCTVSLL